MSRFRMLSAIAVCLTLFVAINSSETEARCWSLSARYDSGYFHDYHNYGALYSHRPYGYYHSYYGARTYTGFSPTGYYGGWSYYAPYAYRASFYSTNYAPSVYSGSIYSRYPVRTHAVGYGPVSTGPIEAYGATCCDASVTYSPGCFTGGYRRGLLGPLCPFRRARCGYGTCGSFGYYGGGYGW